MSLFLPLIDQWTSKCQVTIYRDVSPRLASSSFLFHSFMQSFKVLEIFACVKRVCWSIILTCNSIRRKRSVKEKEERERERGERGEQNKHVCVGI